jgi:hypothetical protein
MRSFHLLLILLFGATLAFAPLVGAQDDIDIPSIAEAVLERDAESLVPALQTPMDAGDLPPTFSNAEYVDSGSVPGDTGNIAGETMGDVIGTVMYSIDYQPGTGASASPSPVASPAAGGPASIYTTASLNYVVYGEEINPESLEGLDEVLLDTIGDQAAEVEVSESAIDDTVAYVITISTLTNGIQVVMQWVAVPVGNVAVISMAMSGGVNVDVDALREDALALAIAGTRYLGAAAQDESQPAG